MEKISVFFISIHFHFSLKKRIYSKNLIFGSVTFYGKLQFLHFYDYMPLLFILFYIREHALIRGPINIIINNEQQIGVNKNEKKTIRMERTNNYNEYVLCLDLLNQFFFFYSISFSSSNFRKF